MRCLGEPSFLGISCWVCPFTDGLHQTGALQHVHTHQHTTHPPDPEPSHGLIDNFSGTLLNAFSKARRPDERFLDMWESVDRSEEGLNISGRSWNSLCIFGRTVGGTFLVQAILFATLRPNELM